MTPLIPERKQSDHSGIRVPLGNTCLGKGVRFMASWEMQLISRILRKSQLKEVLEWGMEIEDFLTDEGRHMFNHLCSYAQHPETAGAQLGEYAARQAYPNFIFCDDESMTIQALCHEVRQVRLRQDAKGIAQRMIDMADQNPLEAMTLGNNLTKQGLELGYSKSDDVTFASSLNRIVNRVELLEKGVDLSVAPWPWEIFNEVTGGLEVDDYVVLYGRPKSMKSWVLAWFIAYTYNMGRKPLIYTKEMTPDNIFMRVAACLAELPYQEFRRGKLSLDEKARLYALRAMVSDMMSGDDMICLSGKNAPGGKDTVEWLQSKIEKHCPAVAFIDGMYLMSDSKGPAKQKDNFRVQNISRGVRQMVLDTGVPIVATFQATRGAAKHQGAELDEIAFSDAIGQDATAAIRVINEKTSPTIALVVGGSREYAFHGCRIYGIPATNFGFHSELTEKEIMKAKEKDASEEEAGNPNAHARPRDNARQEIEKKSKKALKDHMGTVKPIA